MKQFSKNILILLLSLWTVTLSAQIPTGYYDGAVGKKEGALKTALSKIILPHKQLEYYASSTYFFSTDWNPDGYLWDMYSNNKRATWSGLNREHSLPKSWFGVASGDENSIPAGTDLHNLYPSDATANSKKSNFSLGEVIGTPVYTNGVVKVGTNGLTFTENKTNYTYSGTVFEPSNEYKGDFARDYMYMVTCYEDFANRWQSLGTSSLLLGGSTYPVFSPWGIRLMMKWHRQDPVSKKEIDRNNAVYKLQNNRNPFIDHPELAEFLWGKYVGTEWKDDGTVPVEQIPLKVYPNPATSTLTLTVNNPVGARYFIDNLNGINQLSGTLTTTATVDVSKLQPGAYLLRLYANGYRQVQPFFVNR